MLLIDQGRGTLKALSRLMPERIKYWALMRMVRRGWWDEQALVTEWSAEVLRHLPPPADATLHRVGDATLKGKHGHKQPAQPSPQGSILRTMLWSGRVQ